MTAFDWSQSCAYNEPHKHRFHREAKKRLQALAQQLNMPRETWSIRSNKAGLAVSGEITLHAETLYVQVSQSAISAGMGVLIRTCKGRADYTGGPNNFLPLAWLDNLEALAGYCQRVLDRDGGRP